MLAHSNAGLMFLLHVSYFLESDLTKQPARGLGHEDESEELRGDVVCRAAPAGGQGLLLAPTSTSWATHYS